MPKKLMLVLLAAIALAACETAADLDQREQDRQDQQFFRQLGGD